MEEENWRKRVRSGVVGNGARFTTPFVFAEVEEGTNTTRRIVYADWIASARAYQPIEAYIAENVLPFYGNTHTNASITGMQSTWFREEARQIIQQCVNANRKTDEVVFAGHGTTACVNKLVHMLGLTVSLDPDLTDDERPVVFVGPFEHHSNLLPWRESCCDVVQIKENKFGRIDVQDLQAKLILYGNRPLRIGSFSAASNVTGIRSDVDKITAILHRNGALACWDYACAGPYVSIDMNPVLPGDHPDRAYVHKDAVFISPHKFLGGINSPGILVAKKRLFQSNSPSRSSIGGGTVFFVTENGHRYSKKRTEREEGGTPDVVGCIRAGLAFHLKQKIGVATIEAREAFLCKRIKAALGTHPNIYLLGPKQDGVKGKDLGNLAIASFLISNQDKFPGRFLHYNYVSSLLNDLYGIQCRGGCMCAGPYAQRLLGMSAETIRDMEDILVREYKTMEVLRPGFTRMSIAYFASDAEADFILEAIRDVAELGWRLLPLYRFNERTGEWKHRARQTKDPDRLWLSHANLGLTKEQQSSSANLNMFPTDHGDKELTAEVFHSILKQAKKEMQAAEQAAKEILSDQTKMFPDDAANLRWFVLPSEALSILHGRPIPSEFAKFSLSSEPISALPEGSSDYVFDPRRYWIELSYKNEMADGVVAAYAGGTQSHFQSVEVKTENASQICENGSCFRIRQSDKFPLRTSSTIRIENYRSQVQSMEECNMEKHNSTDLAEQEPAKKKQRVHVESPQVQANIVQVNPSETSRTKTSVDQSQSLIGLSDMKRAKLFARPPKKLLHLVMRTLREWDMIAQGDRLLLGLSGGKDSLALLHILLAVQRSFPFKFELAACTIDPVTESYDPSPLIPYMESLGVRYHYIKTPILENAIKSLSGTSICAYCARMKRGTLYTCARKHGYNKLVLAQHLDDLAETMIMSLFHNGSLRTMKANYQEKKGDVTVIRPLIYVREDETKAFSYSAKLPVINENCPACFEAPQERRRIKKLLSKEEASCPQIFPNIRRAMLPLMEDGVSDRLSEQSRVRQEKGKKKLKDGSKKGKRGGIEWNQNL